MNETPVSEKTKEGMTLTIDDIGFIKRRFDKQDDWIKGELADLAGVIKGDIGLLLSQVRSMTVSVNKVVTDIKAIRKDVNSLKIEFNIMKNEVADINERLDFVESEVKNIKINLGLKAS